jgi:hypothetical protein
MTEREQPQTEYYTVDEAIGQVRLWRDDRYTLRLKAHVADEIYRESSHSEIIPLKQPRGVRTSVHAKPYVLIPDIRLTVGLSPAPDQAGKIGEVQSSAWEGMRHEELGTCMGWYYPEDRAIVLWEAHVLPRYRSDELLDDTNTYALWEGFEGFLVGRFPSANRIVTTHDDPEYEPQELYRQFLSSMGYHALSERAWGKILPLPERRI